MVPCKHLFETTPTYVGSEVVTLLVEGALLAIERMYPFDACRSPDEVSPEIEIRVYRAEFSGK